MKKKVRSSLDSALGKLIFFLINEDYNYYFNQVPNFFNGIFYSILPKERESEKRSCKDSQNVF